MNRLWEQSNITTSQLVSKINELSNEECLNTRYLSLYQNNVTHIPKEIGRFQNLQTLGFQGNKVSSSAMELSELKKLTDLYFASSLLGNPLKQIPLPVYSLINLTDLTLSKCHLTYISHLIGNLINLERLNIEENNLRYLPTELGKLKNLNELTFYGNKLPKKLMSMYYKSSISGKTELLLAEIQKYYAPREEKIRKSIYQFLTIMKYKNMLPKDIRNLIGKLLWDSRQELAWSHF